MAGKSFGDIIEAALDLIPSNENMERFANAKSVALQVTALKYADNLQAACDRILQKIQSQGVKGYRVENLVQEARVYLDEIEGWREEGEGEEEDAAEPVVVHEIYPGAPVPEDAIFPPGWEMAEDGMWGRDDSRPVSPEPICLVSRGRGRGHGEEIVEVAWRRDGDWKQRVIPRKVMADARSLVSLSAAGFPVTSNTARGIVDYLADYETANRESLPIVNVSDRLGFCESVFLGSSGETGG